MSDVLIMTTREFGDPVAGVIDMKACDYPFHDGRPTSSPDSDPCCMSSVFSASSSG